MVIFLEKVAGNIVLSFEVSIYKTVRGAQAVLQVDIFAQPVILAGFSFVGRPFVACYVCSIASIVRRLGKIQEKLFFQ